MSIKLLKSPSDQTEKLQLEVWPYVAFGYHQTMTFISSAQGLNVHPEWSDSVWTEK